MDAKPELVICTNHHVTDPWVDWDTYSDMPLSKVGPGRPASYIERGSDSWTQICRRVTKRGVGSPHQCRAVCKPLHEDPAMEAAYKLGGEPAVQEIAVERLMEKLRR